MSNTPDVTPTSTPTREGSVPSSVTSQQTQSDSESQERPPTREAEVEHAYWAEFEEDTTTPDEEELKEIEGAEADYSARDRMCQW